MQMQHLKNLIESRPMLDRVPDQSLITNARGTNDRIQATRGNDYLFVYSSEGMAFNVNTSKISGKQWHAYWYDPRNGEAKDAGTFSKTTIEFNPPTSGYGQDWVLIVDDAAKGYAVPGIKK
jgi:hypothetical protein